MSIHPPGLGPISRRTFDAVLFDLDGTLIDSTGVVERSWARWAREWGLDLRPGDVPHGVPARQVLARLIPAQDVDAAFAHIEGIEVEDVDGIVVLPGAARALAAIPSDRVAIVTSGSAPLAKARIAATGLLPPPVLITPEDTRVGKPHPDPYLEAARRLAADPTRCLVVEDAPAGLAAARAAGCASLAVTTTHQGADLDALAVVDALSDVLFESLPEGIVVHPATTLVP